MKCAKLSIWMSVSPDAIRLIFFKEVSCESLYLERLSPRCDDVAAILEMAVVAVIALLLGQIHLHEFPLKLK
jgi:hypothetical protein